MYKKGSALELQFSPARLNDGAGDPFWIDLTTSEAERLLAALQARLGRGADGANSTNGASGTDATTGLHAAHGIEAPLVFSLDGDSTNHAEHANDAAQNDTEPTVTATPSSEFRQWVCVICGWVYDEAAGCPEDGLAPGTRWEDVPDDWRCPLCDVGKADFALVEF
jgi:rubredoxin